MNKKQVAQLVATLAAAFPNGKVSERTSQVYEESLADLDFDVAKNACARLVSTANFMPTIAEIRRTCADITLGPQRSGEQAYDIVLQAVRQYGWPSPPRFRDPHIQRAIGTWGSWADLCVSPSDDPGGRARFIALYEQLAQAERADIVSGKPLPKPRAGMREFGLPKPKPQLQQEAKP